MPPASFASSPASPIAAPVWIAADRIAALISMPQAIDALRRGFWHGARAVARQRQAVDADGAAILQTLAWAPGIGRSVKIMSAVPANRARGLPTSSEALCFFHHETGQLLAVIEAAPLTGLRTAAASALAAERLAPPEACRLALVATGPLAAPLAVAHASVRPLRQVVVCGRDAGRAAAAAKRVSAALDGIAVTCTTDIEAALREADIVSAATRATAPVIRGGWLRPGCHVDLVGGYTPEMREADDDTVRDAEIWLDQREAGMRDPGDIVTPLKDGVITPAQIRGDLADLVRLEGTARSGAARTVFKSIGCALEDLYAAHALLTAAGILPAP